MGRENIHDLARKAISLLILDFVPRKNESLESFVSRCESELKKATAKGDEYAETRA